MKRPGAKVEKVYYESEPVDFRKSIVGHSVERQTTCGYIQLLAKVRYGSIAVIGCFRLRYVQNVVPILDIETRPAGSRPLAF